MTDDERDIITSFIQRVSGANRLGGGSVPGTVQALPPVDPGADALIGQLFQQYPEARYRLTQTAFVQEHALTEAQNRISQLQTQIQQLQQAQPAQSAPQSGGGFFHNLFGSGQAQQPPQQSYQPYPQQPQYAPPPPQYAPSYQPGMFQRGGSGFLGSALTTAAGVAGGLVAGNALMNLFEGRHEGGGFGGGFGGGYGSGFGGGPGYEPGAGGPWDAPPQDAQVTGSAWDNQVESGQPAGWGDQGGTDPGGWDQSTNTDSDNSGAWDNSGDQGGDSGAWDNNNN